MAGATHPFFGNQYTDGGYITGSFKFPKGLTREVGERMTKISVSEPTIVNELSSKATSLSPKTVKTSVKGKWIVPVIIISTITAAGGYLAYRLLKKKNIIKIPNVGICEYCGEPLTESELIPEENNPYIICKKCGEKNYAKYPDNEISKDLNETVEGIDKMDRAELKNQIDELMRQYSDEKIDGDTYSQKMMELTSSYQNEHPSEE